MPGLAAVSETPAVARLPGGDLPYLLRRSPRASRLRVTIHPERGVVVTIPLSARRGWSRPETVVTGFLREREPWVRRHLARQADVTQTVAAIGCEFDILPHVLAAGQFNRLMTFNRKSGARETFGLLLGGGWRVEVIVHPTHRGVHRSVKGNAVAPPGKVERDWRLIR